jgi:hypothetical protein
MHYNAAGALVRHEVYKYDVFGNRNEKDVTVLRAGLVKRAE